MGAGIAALIKKRYPMTFEAYQQVYEGQCNHLSLGQVITVECPDGRTVFNAVTQEFYGREPGKVYVSYDAIALAIAHIDAWAQSRSADEMISVAFPKIGAGLANGDWERISGIIEEGATHFQPVVYVL